jgi:t-SNARE complex subunit (syntaxin)
MNKKRRGRLEKLVGPLEDIKSQIETILEEEQEAFDNIPENLQDGEKGEKSQNVISSIESVIQSIDEAISSINESIE